MQTKKINFVRPSILMIFIKSLTEEITIEAIQAHAQNDGFL